ncbi:fibrinogen-like protein 1 isoform X1 [Dysidea avara]|uniref:fibrinogen-like protein 1 isoform X1 n=1 Tax=Dysidea avara TaxID=196820 RepID=UPI0033338A90
MNIITQLVILILSLLLVKVGANPLKYYATRNSVPVNSCCDVRVFPLARAPSGVYKMSTNMGTFTTTDMSTNIYCDMTTDDGGWIVIQRNRKNSQLSFNKNWREYEDGFGDLNNDFWAGLKLMNVLTQTGQWEMRVDYQKNDKTWSYLHYNQFSVGSANEEYSMATVEFTGEEVDYFTSIGSTYDPNKMKFSTYDRDNDNRNGNCAANFNSGWWHNNCFAVNPNRQPPQVKKSALFVEMKIRPKDCIRQL